MLQVRFPIFGPFLIGAFVAGCVGREAPATTDTREGSPSVLMAGWYSQNANGASFQPCGSSAALSTDAPALRQRAQDFELQDDLPVYVRVRGTRTGKAFNVASVEQFGSPVPIRDCPMSGTTIQR